MVRRFFDAIDRRDMRMIERGQKLGFVPEAVQPFPVAREQIGEHFDRDVTFEARIPRPIHLAHAAGAQQRDDFIRSD